MKLPLYVGNLSFDTTEQDLKELFGRFGQVESVTVVMDKATGRSRGSTLVERGQRALVEHPTTATQHSLKRTTPPRR